MKRILIILTIISSLFGCRKEDINPKRIYEGDVTLHTQKEVDDFGALEYTIITGFLENGSLHFHHVVSRSISI